MLTKERLKQSRTLHEYARPRAPPLHSIFTYTHKSHDSLQTHPHFLLMNSKPTNRFTGVAIFAQTFTRAGSLHGSPYHVPSGCHDDSGPIHKRHNTKVNTTTILESHHSSPHIVLYQSNFLLKRAISSSRSLERGPVACSGRVCFMEKSRYGTRVYRSTDDSAGRH